MTIVVSDAPRIADMVVTDDLITAYLTEWIIADTLRDKK